MKIIIFNILVILMANLAWADEQRFRIEGKTLFYDTDIIVDKEDDIEGDITWEDVDKIETILSENEIRLLNINSIGGYISASYYLADLVIDYDLDTNVSGSCESACTTVFLGGNQRTVDRGSRVGFHQSYWGAEAIEDYYNKSREEEGWQTPFEFASWLHQDTQDEILTDLEYLIERGVSAAFAIKTLQASSDDMWYPRRKQLEKAGVIKLRQED